MASHRQLVTVQGKGDQKKTVKYPAVLQSPIRSDVVLSVHTRMAKNHRQPYAVSKFAGAQTSAESWGTGRAVSRIPRVAGGGTHRSGQGAFGNMCRGGRMFAPTKVWRRWHVKVSKGQRRYATCSALSASALAPLVIARGHRVEALAEIPLVVSDADIDHIAKTKEAVVFLNWLGIGDELTRVKDSHNLRAGKGKARNRRYVQRRGPLLIHNKERTEKSSIVTSFRNIPGLDTCNVHRLNLLQLAPGGHVGRLIIWTESAFKALDGVFGTAKTASAEKSGFHPPTAVCTNADIGRIMRSEEVQSALRPLQKPSRPQPRKRNPLVNAEAMARLNPFALTRQKRLAAANQKSAYKRKDKVKKNREFVKQLLAPAIAPVRGEDEYAPF